MLGGLELLSEGFFVCLHQTTKIVYYLHVLCKFPLADINHLSLHIFVFSNSLLCLQVYKRVSIL